VILTASTVASGVMDGASGDADAGGESELEHAAVKQRTTLSVPSQGRCVRSTRIPLPLATSTVSSGGSFEISLLGA
jgi:hypothetical protein